MVKNPSPGWAAIAMMVVAISLLLRDNRQNQRGWMLAIVIDGVRRLDPMRRIRRRLAGVQVAVEAREIAARDFEAQLVSGKEDVARRPEVDGQLVDLSGIHELRPLLRVPVARAQDALGQVLGEAVRPDVNQLGGEVGVDRG